MIRFYSLFFLIDLALVLVALIDCLASDESDLRALPKVVWVFIILLFSPIGPIAYLIAGRPLRSGGPRRTWAQGSGFPEYERPRGRRPSSGPDDDPDFLRRIGQQNREDADLLRQWEADLRRREEDLRRSDD